MSAFVSRALRAGCTRGRPACRQLWHRLTRAVEEGHAARLALIQRAARDDWRAAAWLQERLDPERWSLRHKVEHTGTVGVLSFGDVLRMAEERNREASGMSVSDARSR